MTSQSIAELTIAEADEVLSILLPQIQHFLATQA